MGVGRRAARPARPKQNSKPIPGTVLQFSRRTRRCSRDPPPRSGPCGRTFERALIARMAPTLGSGNIVSPFCRGSGDLGAQAEDYSTLGTVGAVATHEALRQTSDYILTRPTAN